MHEKRKFQTRRQQSASGMENPFSRPHEARANVVKKLSAECENVNKPLANGTRRLVMGPGNAEIIADTLTAIGWSVLVDHEDPEALKLGGTVLCIASAHDLEAWRVLVAQNAHAASGRHAELVKELVARGVFATPERARRESVKALAELADVMIGAIEGGERRFPCRVGQVAQAAAALREQGWLAVVMPATLESAAADLWIADEDDPPAWRKRVESMGDGERQDADHDEAEKPRQEAAEHNAGLS